MIIENIKKSIISNKKIYFLLLLYSFLTFPILVLSMICISVSPSSGGVIGVWGIALFIGTIVALLILGITLGVKMFRDTQMFLFPNIYIFVCTFISVLLTHIMLLGSSFNVYEVFAITIALCALPILSSLICLIRKIKGERNDNKNLHLD